MPDRSEAVELGRMMREMREAHKRDLPQVAAELRIRQVYLQAIEEGRYSDLPGPTYALGFVRAYADYLGLEPEDTVQRFKNALGGLNSPTNLILPSPVTEGRLPTGSILLVAAILAIGAYGGWYYLTTHGDGSGDIVSALPDRLARLIGPRDGAGPASEPASSETGGTATAATASIPPRDEPKPPAKAESAPKSTEVSPKPAPKPAAPPPRAETPAPKPAATETAAPAPPAAPEPPPSVAMAPAPPEPIAEPVSRGPEPEGRATAGNATESAADSQEAAESSAATAEEGASPRGESDEVPETQADAAQRPVETLQQASRTDAPAPAAMVGGGIILLKATADSWVEVRDAQNNRVFSRVLRAGETYDVPAASGLTMMTGNAGALEIMVRGQQAPSLGPIGAVRRDVALDPERLLAGTAAAN